MFLLIWFAAFGFCLVVTIAAVKLLITEVSRLILMDAPRRAGPRIEPRL
jgi:hypothetical protein